MMQRFKIMMFIFWVVVTLWSIINMALAMCMAEYSKEFLTLTVITTIIGTLTTMAIKPKQKGG